MGREGPSESLMALEFACRSEESGAMWLGNWKKSGGFGDFFYGNQGVESDKF